MAQAKPIYEPLDEFIEIARQLADKYSEAFPVNIDQLRAVVITNKDRAEKSKKLWQIKGVPYPIRMDCPYSHYVVMFASDWEKLLDKHRSLLVAQILLAIPAEEEGSDGKVNSFDMKDFATMLRTFGPDYLVRDDVPDLLEENVEWVF